EYGGKRSSERLAAPELAVLKPGSFDARRQRRLAGGASDSQIKPTHLTRDASFGDQFEVLERFHAT
ncbi:MAG: GH3 auxin-responsive promoter family protein, partial [Myxococcales bacterium]|nr:GH3 auxin-responsive promoter family protein [Myxococcales bacterium]